MKAKKGKIFYFFIGTTAELIKLAPVIKRLDKKKARIRIVTSGQNFIDFKELEPIVGKQGAYFSFKHKTIKVPGSVMLTFLFWSLVSLMKYLPFFSQDFRKIEKKDIIFIVHGDTVSALLGAIVAKINNVKLVHIEAGYRSFNFFEPFPEELCRYLISKLANIHFCPTEWTLNNIRNHNGIKIHTGENTVYESCINALKTKTQTNLVNKIIKKKFFLLILHRQEHMLFKKDLAKKYLEDLISFTSPKMKCVLILHNITENFLNKENLMGKIRQNKNIIAVQRLPYFSFMKLLDSSEFIATDGGSNQQEAYYLGKPCLLLRKYTEQSEGLNSNAVLAKDNPKIVKRFLANYKNYRSKKVTLMRMPSEIIVDYLSEEL